MPKKKQTKETVTKAKIAETEKDTAPNIVDTVEKLNALIARVKKLKRNMQTIPKSR